MELDQLSVAQRFVRDLTQLRQRAGRPSYSTLERLSRHQLKRATVSDVLNGNRVNLPDWRFVATFVTACRAAAEESGLDANELGTVADWKRHWDGASSGVIDARFPGHGVQSFARHEPAVGADPVVASWSEPPVAADGIVRARPAIWGPVPSRLPDFVGREGWLEALHHALTRDDRVGVVAIQGLFGVGKTQLALEYAHRYSHEYDLVWWIPRDDAESAHGAMTDLAARLGLEEVSQPSEGSNHGAVFDLLRRDPRYARWLLIFDDVNEPEEIRDLIPPTTGHVLVTTRSSRWEASGDMLELDVFDREESIEFLRRRVRKFNALSAHRLAEGVGDLPLLLEHAVESRIATSAYLARLERDPLGLLDDQPADYHASIAGEWGVVLDRLRADAPDALDLLRCLAFFGNDPVPRESLERGSYIAEVSVHEMLRDPFRRIGAIRKLRRSGLLRVGAGTGSFELHRVTRCVVRDMVATSGVADEERVRHDVHLLLAAADPLAPDDPATWQTYEELRGHAADSGVAVCSREMVRKLVVNLVRFLNATGDPRAALNVADATLSHWDMDGAEGSAKASDSRLVIRMAKADALFAYGKRADAFQLRQEVLASMRSDPDRWAAEIIQLDGTFGARSRIAGRFSEALAADRESVRTHIVEFGNDDPRTFTAIDGLVADLTLAGSAREATRTASDAYRDCLAFYSDAGHPAVLAARNALGRCRWLAGHYGEAISSIAEAHDGYQVLASRGILDENHPWRLLHEIDFAVARRDKGVPPAQIRGLAEDMADIRRRCWRMLGADHQQTLAATVVLGSLLRRASGRAAEAARLLRDAERHYHSALPDHPYSHACTGYLAAVRCLAANGGLRRAASRSVPVIRAAVDRLTDSVGEAHPLLLTAAAALANALARAGELEAAAKAGQDALAGFQALFGADHPYALTSEINLRTIQSWLGREPVPEDLRTRYVATLNPDHPDAALFAQGGLIDIDFTPLPL
ncbi:MAG TPA: FxSxx-COOH system tetratricopeptide repeat protein [Streptosporangiaceae bacterium]